MKTPKRNLEECIVCREVKPRWFIRRLVGRSAFPLRADFPKSCRHDPPMCKTCIARSLEMILMSKGPEKMGCPQCPELWSVKYIQKFASPEVFEKYSRFRLHRVLATTPNFCLCASPTCESGQVHPDGAESPLMICKQCGFKTCFVHQRPWHPAFTCEQIDEQDREHNKASLRWIQKSAKKCPGIGCGWLIEKVAGCDHMTCTRCNHQWCYKCLADSRDILMFGSHCHAPSCVYYKPLQVERGDSVARS